MLIVLLMRCWGMLDPNLSAEYGDGLILGPHGCVERFEATNGYGCKKAAGPQFCALSFGQYQVNDLPNCLRALENLGRLDLAQGFIEAAQNKIDQLK
jgi:hypothetical protein